MSESEIEQGIPSLKKIFDQMDGFQSNVFLLKAASVSVRAFGCV